MPNKPIDFKFTSDVVALLNGLGKSELAVEDLEQAFVEASNSSTDLERKISRATKDAEQDVEKLEKAIRKIPDATDDAADKASADFKRFGDDAGEAGREAGQNLAGNFGEGMSSGDLQDTLQDTMGEIIGGLGGGGPIGAAVAVGAGIALALWNSFADKSAKLKEKIAEQFSFTDLLTGELDKMAQIEAGLTELGGGDYATGVKDASQYAHTLGVEFGDIADLMTGQITPENEKLRQTLQYQLDHLDASTANYWEQKIALQEVLGTANLQKDASEDAAAATANMRTYLQESGVAIDPLLSKVQKVASTMKETTSWKIGLDFYATDPLGQSLIQKGNVNYSPGHVAIAQSQLRERAG